MRLGESDNQDKIRDCKNAAAYELPPLPGLRVVAQKRQKRSEDKNEMPDPAQRHHHRYKLLYVSSAQRRPEGDRTRLHEVRDEETKPVPDDRDSESGSKSPCAVTARKNDDSNVDQGLHEVEKAEFGNNNRRYEQRHKEKCRS